LAVRDSRKVATVNTPSFENTIILTLLGNFEFRLDFIEEEVAPDPDDTAPPYPE